MSAHDMRQGLPRDLINFLPPAEAEQIRSVARNLNTTPDVILAVKMATDALAGLSAGTRVSLHVGTAEVAGGTPARDAVPAPLPPSL